ncbi:MAG TPA: hypothetical protein VFS71_12290 [Flavobacterium sp.]|uniref:hypothetical protein n=1 Tax=Flavobacterium sp. TaxID=239 RepID=UPI002DBAE11F|nr:hypothetical protein [Flavobacterium sp.]HEU4790460.1 hypothetical protein [Flavobacterium sp.]
MKNYNPIYFYFVSIIAFVLANVFRDKSIPLYYALLIIGFVFFVLGVIRRVRNK